DRRDVRVEALRELVGAEPQPLALAAAQRHAQRGDERVGGEWVFPVLTLIALAALFAENMRLRKKLRELGVEPKSRDKGPKA
ncbi:hypothetical protein PPH41_30825, partial [Burkholderia gladioli]|nr:hypothetical protein [Burkholderia gladioli]